MSTQVCSSTTPVSLPDEAARLLSNLLEMADTATLSGNKARAIEAISAAMAYAADIEARGKILTF